jgi:hypothetical protein
MSNLTNAPTDTEVSSPCEETTVYVKHEISFDCGKMVIEIAHQSNELSKIIAIKEKIETEKGIPMWKQLLIPDDYSENVWTCASVELDYILIDSVDTITVLYEGEQIELEFQKSLLDLCIMLHPPHLGGYIYNKLLEFLLKKAAEDLEIEEGLVFKCKQQENGEWKLVKTNKLRAEQRSREESIAHIIGLYVYSKRLL